MDRELVWTLLWRFPDCADQDIGWVTSKMVYVAWLDGRPLCGSAFYGDYMSRNSITRHLNRLVEEGRAEVRRRPHKHPEYRALA
jgi:hypothetical protein